MSPYLHTDVTNLDLYVELPHTHSDVGLLWVPQEGIVFDVSCSLFVNVFHVSSMCLQKAVSSVSDWCQHPYRLSNPSVEMWNPRMLSTTPARLQRETLRAPRPTGRTRRPRRCATFRMADAHADSKLMFRQRRLRGAKAGAAWPAEGQRVLGIAAMVRWDRRGGGGIADWRSALALIGADAGCSGAYVCDVTCSGSLASCCGSRGPGEQDGLTVLDGNRTLAGVDAAHGWRGGSL